MHDERDLTVDYLSRVEGEGSLHLVLRGDEITDLRFQIFEPPRFFEALLRGRRFTEAPDITARICGICPVAYQVSACNAMEDAAGVAIPAELEALRRLIYCGEWLESHALHVFFLHAPDFLGYESGIAMASDFPDRIEAGLRLKRVGNRIMSLLGGREIHPVNLRVGGFYRVPTRSELDTLTDDLEWGLEAAVDTVRWAAGLPFPEFEREYEFVALTNPDGYAIQQGRIVSSSGLDIAVEAWPQWFAEEQVPWSNALHARTSDGRPYHVGPMARYSLNADQLTHRAREEAERAGLGSPVVNPFRSIVVRAVEMVFACEEALSIIDGYRQPEPPSVEVAPAGATGHGASEAPRGLLYHRYDVDAAGLITDAHIVPPTSQNQLSIENDLRAFIPGRVALGDEELQWQLEQAIRNYDPCISCATHFLDLTVERS
jgi:coenzyme F420-reducing hydrogenase alpha subunit